ncbi:ABC transporter permease [Halorubrum lipolyticum]|uniref:Binding-protein-dependent transport system inner membrane protein n=1 Tax=Halorubrum lipolyticum DSM 21995 TaxID=1227482 RepID=M0P043_9EURY|nr:iron ABC transporter permease [Halorubrum lipolyticum]EMA62894.1 binding-protein-dependent transport system inner membrane protein [Halorubrum lipolyticum DSM 21995]
MSGLRELYSRISAAISRLVRLWTSTVDHPRAKGVVLKTIVGTVAVLTLVPLLFLLWTSVWTGYPGQFDASFTLDNVLSVYIEGAYNVPTLLSHSVFVALGMTLIAMSLGLTFAWLFVRTNLPTKGAMELVLLSPYAVPGYISALMYITTYDPNNGLVSTFLADTLGVGIPINIFSPLGITIVVGINGVTAFYLFTVPALQNMDPALEEVSRIHGANIFQTIRSISFPLILPAILSGALVTFLRGLGEFSVVEILGVREGFDVYATAIWAAIQQQAPPEYGQSAALALSLLLVTAVLMWYYRRLTSRNQDYMTVTGRGYQPDRWDLGRWRWPIAATLWVVLFVLWILPLVVMIAVSFHSTWLGQFDPASLSLIHYADVLTSQRLQESFLNSGIVAVTGATLGTILVVGIAYYTQRTAYRFRSSIEFLSLTPLAIPGIILGTGVLFTVLWVGRIHPLLNFYGTLGVIIIGSVIVFIPFSSRIAIGNIVQIHSDLEDVARVSGASWVGQMREIFLPLFKNTTAILWFYLLVHIVQLLSIPIMTYTSDTRVIPVDIFDIYYQQANIELVSAVSTIFVLLLASILVVFRLFGIRFYDLDHR